MGIGKRIQQGAAILGLATLAMATLPVDAQSSLYDSVGGEPVIAKVVDDFVGHVVADPRINFQFAKTNLRHLKAMLNDQLCAVLGGPCQYEGETMKNAHAGMNVTNAQFNALAETCTSRWSRTAFLTRRRTPSWRCWRRCNATS